MVRQDNARGRPAELPQLPLDPAESASRDAVKPRLRGWLHAGASPLVVAATVVLLVLAPTRAARLALIPYLLGGGALFITSALYHRLTWSPSTAWRLKRLDHSNIYLMIAGSYTPIVALGLNGTARLAMLWFVWTAALAGSAFRVFWVGAPRVVYTTLYAVLGWSVLIFVGELFARNGPAVGVLVLAGGVAYTLGALVYALKRPDPWPQWFGFHEVFHACTIAGWVCQYVAISLLVYRN